MATAASSISASYAGLPAESPSRPPWPAAAASILAMAVFSLIHHDLTFVAGIAVAIAYFTDFRMARWWVTWMVRCLAFGAVYLYSTHRVSSVGSFTLEDNLVASAGRLFAAELAVQFWRLRPEGGGNGVVTLFLSAVVYTTACDTGSSDHIRYVRYITPLYAFFILLSLPRFRREPDSAAPLAEVDRKGRRIRGVVYSIALLNGAAVAFALFYFQAEINFWTMKLMSGKAVTHSVGLSFSPKLGSTFEMDLSDTPVLRISGHCGEDHFRGMAFDTYSSGAWGPRIEKRTFESVLTNDLKPVAKGETIEVTRLAALYRIVFAPLNAEGVDARSIGPLQWSIADGGPLRTYEHYVSIPNAYTVIISADPFNQGVFCVPPRDKALLLDVPEEIDPRVKTLARKIGETIADPLERVRAVEQYLKDNHQYSFSTDAGKGDPLSNFLLEKKSGHCVYFASAAVMLLRCLKVPSRYVEGLYAHEADGDGIIVRERDAHAWAESWIEGRGWITVEATPSSGMPDKKQLSIWTKFWDVLKSVRKYLGDHDWQWWAAGSIAALVAAYMFSGRIYFRKRRKQKLDKETGYSFPNNDLSELAGRFENALRRQGAGCPGPATWDEHLCALEAAVAAEAALAGKKKSIGAESLNQVKAFLSEYNAIRFGSPENRDAIARLNATLCKLEA